ncbi:MAG: hypothetical protein AAFR54_16580 [Planctomycetota bacterium]
MLSLLPGVSLLCSFAAAPALAPAPPAAQSVNTSPATPVLRYRAPDVELVAVSPRDPDLVVAVYDTSISHGPSGVALVRSEDGGATFQALDAQAIFPVVARARHLEFSWTGALYLADETSLYRSTDRGASFVQVHEIPGGEIRDLALDPFDGDRVFVAAVASDGSSADTHSTDAGSTWASTPLPPGTPAHHTTEFAVFDVAAPNRLLRARHYGRFSITDVSGQNVHASFPWTLGLGAGLGGVALIGDRVLVSGGSLYVSEDCGASFTAVPGLERILSSVVVHPLRPNQMVALSEPYYLDPYSSTADSRRFGSNDEGRTWFQLDAGRFDNDLNSNAVVIAPRQSAVDDVRECTLLTGHPGGLTIGRAGTETPVSVPLPAGSFPVENASIDRENADVWIHPPHGNGYRRFWTYTLDRGATWRRVSAPMAAGCHAVRVQGDGGVVLRCYGEFFSVDSGGVLTQGPLSASGLGHPIAGFDEVDLLSLNGHLAVTLDMWQSWYWVDDLPPLGFSIDRQWIDGKIRRVPGGVEVLSRKSQMLYLIGNRCTHQVTSDLGVTWRVIPEAGSMGSVTWNEIEPDVVYASDNDPTTSTRRSVDGGVTWTPVGSAASAPSIARGNLDPNLVVRGVDESGSSALGTKSPIATRLRGTEARPGRISAWTFQGPPWLDSDLARAASRRTTRTC